jgi:ankyrin repeat protein
MDMPNNTDRDAVLNFHRLIKRGDIDGLRALVDSGADVNVRGPNGATPLMSAAVEGNVATIEFLLARGADVCATDVSGVSALAWASSEGKWRAVQALLEAGAPVNVRPDGLTLLEFTQHGRGFGKTKRHIELLKEAGAE